MSLMNIDGLGNTERINGYSFVENSLKPKTQDVSTSGDFEMFFKAAMDALNETSKTEQEAQNLQLNYITGKSDDMLSVVMAEQRAYTALNFTVQVTNKIIESYRQIISMQL
ncbi:MAG: flagellar hook-basal body complex protein FliE [Clostridiales bacterium]|nr:flagellar hook-basal body complex protein FliE [Clostridiales bacterium]